MRANNEDPGGEIGSRNESDADDQAASDGASQTEKLDGVGADHLKRRSTTPWQAPDTSEANSYLLPAWESCCAEMPRSTKPGRLVQLAKSDSLLRRVHD